MSDDFARYVLKLIKDDKKKYEEEWIEKSKPKNKQNKITSGKRGKFMGEIRYTNTEETAEGKDNKYYFEGDDKAVFTKATFTAKDKSYQNHTHKACKSSRYMGGSKSNADDGMCCGAVIWDRAIGSKAIKDTGISPAKFRIRCGNTAVVNQKCKNCDLRNPNFFTDKYEMGAKAKGSKYNGMTYKEFIEAELVYASESEDEDEDEEE